MSAESGIGLRPAADDWVAAIHGGEHDRDPLGSGFLIDSQRVLTCAHVAYAGQAEARELWVAFPKAEDLAQRRIRVREVVAAPEADRGIRDAAVLLLEETLPEGMAARLRRPKPGDLVGGEWWSFGFPDGALGNSSDGSVGEALAYGWVRLDTASRYTVKRGYSGAALWSPAYQAVVGMVGQALDTTGDARALTMRAIDAYLPDQKLHLLADWAVEAAGESALAAWGWSLEADPDEARRHWRPRARGVSTDSERGFRFRGRTAALNRIVAWITTAHRTRGVLVVTGSPGVGKSAVLGRIVTTADAAIAATLPADDDAVRAPLGSVACAVHAKGKTALEVAAEIARAASAPLLDRVADLAPSLRAVLAERQTSAFTVVIDALDEATTPEQARLIIGQIALPLVETCTDLGVRVVMGSRRKDDAGSLLEPLGPAVRVLDLDTPEYFEESDLASYCLATLQLTGDERPGNPYDDAAVAGPVARRIAALSDRNFLVAGLTARAHGMHDSEPVAPAAISFTPTVEAALREYLVLLPPVGRVSASDALTALAYAEAPGFSLDLWGIAIAALYRESALGEYDLHRFAGSSAANFLVEYGSYDSGPTVFRLFHQALNDALLKGRAELTPSARDERALTGALMAHGQSVGWAQAPAYLLRSLPRHASRGEVVDTLLADDLYPLYADLLRLIPAASSATTTQGRGRAGLLRKTPRAIDATPSTRAAMYSVTETQARLGDTYRTSTLPVPYRGVWTTANAHVEETILEGHTAKVTAVCAVPTGGRSLLASGSEDGLVQVWDAESGELVRTLEVHGGGVAAMRVANTVSRSVLSVCCADGTVWLWQPETGEVVRTRASHPDRTGALHTLEEDSNGILAIGCASNGVWLWRPGSDDAGRTFEDRHRTPKDQEWTPELQKYGPTSLSMLRRGNRSLLAVAGFNGEVKLWDLESGGWDQIWSNPRIAPVTSLCALPDERQVLLATGHEDGLLQVLSAEHDWRASGFFDVRQRGGPDGHAKRVTTMSVVQLNGRSWLASGSDDRTVRLDSLGRERPRTLAEHSSGVSAVCGVQVGPLSLLASGCADGTVWLWDPQATGPARAAGGFSGGVRAVCLAEAGRLGILAAACSDGKAWLWNSTTGRLIRALEGHTDELTAVGAIRARGRTWLATGCADGSIRMWRLRSGTQVGTLEGHIGAVNALCSVRMGHRTLLASGGADGTVRLWKPGLAGGYVRALRGHTGAVTSVCAVDTDGSQALASGSADGTVRLWKPGRKAWDATLPGHIGGVTAMCVLPATGQSLLAVGSAEGTVRVVDLDTGKAVRTLRGHTGGVTAIGLLTVDGRSLLAVGSDDRMVRLWDPLHRRLLMEVPVRYPVVALTQTGSLLVVGLIDGLLTLAINLDAVS
ncbi:AAA family ATPase [Streptacidiphilus sp. N1-3]|uniref:AAA family ATPase n=1 Tax=Streptacidiphilus alkalitolerans TaxID=3342712 RepID=A0ABV6XD25_9ACTN